jgi:6-phosphogluconolactonase
VSLQLHVGTYTRNGGAGLQALTYSQSEWTLGDVSAAAANASFGAFSLKHNVHYLVDEQAEGALTMLRAVAGNWQQLARVSSGGAEPCYLALDAQERCLAVANYGDGAIAVFHLDEHTGLPLEPPAVRRNHGSGPARDRQEGPHAHCVAFNHNQEWLYHVDLGTDQVIVHPIDASRELSGAPVVAFQAPAGSGPRHLVFHPVLPLALLASELASTLTVLQVVGSSLLAMQTISTLPPGFSGQSLAGHLTLNAAGTRAYVTNRGHDSIAVFSWNEVGVIDSIQHVPSGGASPRSIVLLEAERQLVVANEESDNVTVFDLRTDDTLGALCDMIPVPGAVFALVAPK